MSELSAVFMGLVGALPMLVVFVVAVAVAVSRWSQHPKVSMLLTTGVVLMGTMTLAGRVLFSVLPMRLADSGRSTAEVSTVLTALSMAFQVVDAIGLALLIAAAFAERGSPQRAV